MTRKPETDVTTAADADIPVGRIRPGPGSEEAWSYFEAALVAALGDLSEDECLVISRKRYHYFVQFAAQGSYGMRTEAVSNAYIEEPDRLSEDACRHLTDLGWNPPTYVQSARGPEPADGSPNYYLDAAPPVPYTDLARIAVTSLRQVFGVRHPGELEYMGFAADGASIRFPMLKIKRRER
jgi:hypothetical protein